MNDYDFPVLGSKPSKRPPRNNNNNNNNNNTNYIKPVQQPVQQPIAPVIPPVVQPVIQPPQPQPVNKFSIADIGANLAHKSFEKDLNAILTRSSNKGVNTIIITGTSISSSQKAIELITSKREFIDSNGLKIYCTVGVHPHDAERASQNPQKTIDIMRDIAKRNPSIVCSIGECGLDFNRNFSSRQTQIDMFTRQIELAIELKMPLFLHERDSHDTFIQIVSKYINNGTMPKAVVHCFTGTTKEAEVYLKAGFYFGFTGVITNPKRGQELRDILKSKIIPLNRLMIETDCPFMTPKFDQPPIPQPPKSQQHDRNEPAYLTYVLSTLAQCYNITEEEAAQHTLSTTKEFFNLN